VNYNLNLKVLGWNSTLDRHTRENKITDLTPGRVINQSGKHYKIITQHGKYNAILANSYLNSINSKSDIPAVGDWVGLKINTEINTCHIQYLFPRKNKLSRKVAGAKSEEQIIAANIDTVFLVSSVDQDFNIRRFERYLVMINEIDAKPVIILNKIDKCNDLDRYISDAKKISQGIPIIAISAKDGTNIEDIKRFIKPGKTIVLIGSSGVGKSTLINQLLGFSCQSVGEIRESDGKGSHVTSTRELIVLPSGGMLIDNPGIREIQLWSSGEGISKTFKDIEELSRLCKFNDCQHEKEPGCEVNKAIKDGKLTKKG